MKLLDTRKYLLSFDSNPYKTRILNSIVKAQIFKGLLPLINFSIFTIAKFLFMHRLNIIYSTELQNHTHK